MIGGAIDVLLPPTLTPAPVLPLGQLLAFPRYGGRRERRRRQWREPEVLPRPVQRVVDVAVNVFLAQLVVQAGPLQGDHGLSVPVGEDHQRAGMTAAPRQVP